MWTDWLEGGLLVLFGFFLSLGFQFWRDAKKESKQRIRILDYVRLEIEQNRKVAQGIVTLLESGGPPRGYLIITELTNDAWRVAASEWAVTRLSGEASSDLMIASHAGSMLNAEIRAYQNYGVQMGAMDNYHSVLASMAKDVLAGAKLYLESVDRLRLPSV